MEGRRPLLAEVQALLTPSPLERPRRTVSGVESSRVDMVLAVLQRHARLRIAGSDVFVATVGGAKLHDPAADLALAVAVASSHLGVPPPRGAVAIGEIGLAGELRRVRDLPQRIAEASRLGFKVAVVPAGAGVAQRARDPLATRGRRPPRGRGGRRPGRPAHPRPDAAPLTEPGSPDRGSGPRRETIGGSRPTTPTLHPMAHGGAPEERARGGTGGRAHRRAAAAARDPGLDRARHAPARRARTHPARPHRRPDRRWATTRSSSRSRPAASPSTSRSPPPACASWPRWTARSSSTRTSPASTAPRST